MTVRWTSGALRQLRSIERYLQEHEAASIRILARIERAVDRLGRMPRIGRPARQRDVRLLMVTGTRYVVVYGLRGDDVVVLALFHERQQRPTTFLPD